jgi:predicted amidohydrolase
MLRIGIIQMQSAPMDVKANLNTAETLIQEAVNEGAELIILPELFNVGFFLEEGLMEFAEPLIDGITIRWLKTLATKNKVYFVTSLYELYEEHFYNTMILVCSDGSTQFYRKRNPTWQENTLWRRSEVPGPGIFDTSLGRIGGIICFDSFSQESFLGCQKSAVDLVVIIACWGRIQPIPSRLDVSILVSIMDHWSEIATHSVPEYYAQKLKVPVVFVNQGGTIPIFGLLPPPYPWKIGKLTYNFAGYSHVRDASGMILQKTLKSSVNYCSVASLDIIHKERYPSVSRANVGLDYLRSNYYCVQPPSIAKAIQAWSFKGFQKEYRRRRKNFFAHNN